MDIENVLGKKSATQHRNGKQLVFLKMTQLNYPLKKTMKAGRQ
jgi:hypothetical protein